MHINAVPSGPAGRATLARRRTAAAHIAIAATTSRPYDRCGWLARQACDDLGLHLLAINGYDVAAGSAAAGSDVKAEATLRARAERAFGCGPEFCVILVEHIETLVADRMTVAFKDIVHGARVFIATTTELEKITPGLRSLFSHEIEVMAPDENDRRMTLQDISARKGVILASDVDLGAVALKTAALVARDLVDVVDRAILAHDLRVGRLAEESNRIVPQHAQATMPDLQLAGGEGIQGLTQADFSDAVDGARKNFSDSIGAPRIPTVTWEDVGGLAHVKDAVLETIQLPLDHPELFAKGLKKRSGILFYGPPGTGKTLLAKAIATELSLNFFSVKGPELLNMYIGESEANVRRVFQRARDARPCVIFFDELDSVAPKRGNQGDSGGVMDRIVSQLLAELDGMSQEVDGAGGVFVIGATNRPDLLDPALLRPGRFDKMLYLGISDRHEQQLKILEALTRKSGPPFAAASCLFPTLAKDDAKATASRFQLARGTSLARVADQLPFTYSGADLYALCSDAMLNAVARAVSSIEAKAQTTLASAGEPMSTSYYLDHRATEEEIAVWVTEGDFSAAQRELVGSVR
ncbi:MAG: peroxisomal assembly protein [Phylliscum demangeonii]|nr:MAG: peroxisomal assembly protein [Phylliscum demangeonii]